MICHMVRMAITCLPQPFRSVAFAAEVQKRRASRRGSFVYFCPQLGNVVVAFFYTEAFVYTDLWPQS